jgi:replication factor A1
MDEDSLKTRVSNIREQLPEEVDVTDEEIRERLENFLNYQLPADEAQRSVVNSILEDDDIDPDEVSSAGENPLVGVGELDGTHDWVDVEVKVERFLDSDSDSVDQMAIVGDETGTTLATKFTKSNLREIEQGETYAFRSVAVNEYQGDYNLNLNSSTEIVPLDKSIEVVDNSTEIEGALVAIQSGSGLIKRCPKDDCTRVLRNGRCSEHGEVEGEFDLRIKGSIDDGTQVRTVIFDREATEEFTGMTLDDATSIAKDQMDIEEPLNRMKPDILGRYYRVCGPEMDAMILVNDYEQITDQPDIDELLIEARSI